MKYNKYLLRTYNTYLQDVRRERISKFVDDDTAIESAKTVLDLLYSQDATIEIQVCRKGLGMGEWCMFAAVFYDDDGSIVVEDCFS